MKPLFTTKDLQYSSLSEQVIEKNGYRLTIKSDEYATSPREYSNLTIFALFHKEYSFANETEIRSKDYDNWDEVEQAIREQYKPVYITPVSLYDHSGLSFSLGVRQGWDSGRIGFIFITEKSLDEFEIPSDKRTDETYQEYAKHELKRYEDYVEGNIYRFTLEKSKVCECCKVTSYEFIDGCSGFYGDDPQFLLDTVNENIGE